MHRSRTEPLDTLPCYGKVLADQEGDDSLPAGRESPGSVFSRRSGLWLLYVDESGEPTDSHFVLAGPAVFEHDAYFLAQQIDRLQPRYLPGAMEPVEFHASAIRGGREAPWSDLPKERRYSLLDDVYETIKASRAVLFGVAVERARLRADQDAYEYALESLIRRFDTFLVRRYREQQDPQRGLVIIAQSQYRQRLETLARLIRQVGTRWGETYNLAEVPLFTSASNSRLLQVADFCANAIRARYESGLTRQCDRIASRFDEAHGVVHGLFHFSTDHQTCTCPGCLTRRLASEQEG